MARDADGEQAARDDERAEEDGVLQDEEAQQRARRPARAQAGAPQAPERQGRAADAGGRQQPRGARAAERDVGARAHAEARRRPRADHPEEADVADEGEQLEDARGDDPARVGLHGAVDGVEEGVERTAGDHERRRCRGGERRGHGRAPGQRPDVDALEGQRRGVRGRGQVRGCDGDCHALESHDPGVRRPGRYPASRGAASRTAGAAVDRRRSTPRPSRPARRLRARPCPLRRRGGPGLIGRPQPSTRKTTTRPRPASAASTVSRSSTRPSGSA